MFASHHQVSNQSILSRPTALGYSTHVCHTCFLKMFSLSQSWKHSNTTRRLQVSQLNRQENQFNLPLHHCCPNELLLSPYSHFLLSVSYGCSVKPLNSSFLVIHYILIWVSGLLTRCTLGWMMPGC